MKIFRTRSVARFSRPAAVYVAGLALALSACSPTPRASVPDIGALADSAQGANQTADQTYATTAQVLESVKAAENYQRLSDAVAAGLTNEDTIHLSPCYDRQTVENPADANFFGEC